MKHKKGVAFYVFLGIVFSIVYIILAAEPLAKEHQFIPQWKLELNAHIQKADASGEKPLYFKLISKQSVKTNLPYRTAFRVLMYRC